MTDQNIPEYARCNYPPPYISPSTEYEYCDNKNLPKYLQGNNQTDQKVTTTKQQTYGAPSGYEPEYLKSKNPEETEEKVTSLTDSSEFPKIPPGSTTALKEKIMATQQQDQNPKSQKRPQVQHNTKMDSDAPIRPNSNTNNNINRPNPNEQPKKTNVDSSNVQLNSHAGSNGVSSNCSLVADDGWYHHWMQVEN